MASIPEDTRITVDYVEENLTNPWESLSLAVIDEADEADADDAVSDTDVLGSATSEEEDDVLNSATSEEEDAEVDAEEEDIIGAEESDADNIEQTHREFMRQFCIDISVGMNNANCNIPNAATMVFRTEASRQFQMTFCPFCGNYVRDTSETLRVLDYYMPDIICNESLHLIETELIVLDNTINMITQKINGTYFGGGVYDLGDDADGITRHIKTLSKEIEICQLKKQICMIRLSD